MKEGEWKVDKTGRKHLYCSCDRNCTGNHNKQYDSYFCPKCDKWLENKCPDKKCYFCTKRPDKPSMINDPS